jgi:hypothetical protein
MDTLFERAFGTRVELLTFDDRLQTVSRLNTYDQRLKIRPNRLFVLP